MRILREWRGASALVGYYVVRSAADLPSGFPSVNADYSKETLLGVFLGAYQAGPSIAHSVDIVQVTDGDSVEVQVESVYSTTWHKVFLPRPVPDAFHVVAVPATRGPVRFRVHRRDESGSESRQETVVSSPLR